MSSAIVLQKERERVKEGDNEGKERGERFSVNDHVDFKRKNNKETRDKREREREREREKGRKGEKGREGERKREKERERGPTNRIHRGETRGENA